MVSDATTENAAKKEDPLYGPWLLVSYGKQGNRNFKGRYGRPDFGNNNSADRNGYGGKSGGSNTGRKKEGDFPNARTGKSEQVKYGSKELKPDMAKTVDAIRGSGSRFDILNDESDEMGSEKAVLNESKDATVTIQKDKAVLSEITNQSNRKGDNLPRVSSQNSKKKNKNAVKLGGKDSYVSKSSKIGGASSSNRNSCSKDRSIRIEVVHPATECDDNDIDTVGGGDVGGADLNFSNARGGLVLLPATKEVSCLASRWRRAPSPIGGELILTSKQAKPSPATSLEEA
ncbi:hypothetical protein LWI29_012153 [Acer saccharum]|uniref:Uncharacterized protein n=1 Tax=Acer saccharum TaxID=4024 RepID=A0AA39VMY1_ACESA|nr:hypothetical protein LWI29_012153 [Acer saccharum]